MAHGLTAGPERRSPIRMAPMLGLVAALLAALLASACDDDPNADPAAPIPVVINGTTFRLEPALDDATRLKGLGGRTSIPKDGGMLFVFPTAAVRSFVMRDCLTDIDIAFLDPAGRVVATHEMKVEPPRRTDESAMDYEQRLKRYPSRFPSQFVIEVAPGALRPLGLKVGDLVELDTAGLKRRVR